MTPAALPGVVLYAEDDENDAFLIRHCWKRAGVADQLQIVPDGSRAIECLREIIRTAAELPKLVLLDLNLPQVTGMQVLAWIRQQPPLAGMPVAILSSSNQKKDLDDAEALGVDAYFVKPANVTELAQLVTLVRERWLGQPRSGPLPPPA